MNKLFNSLLLSVALMLAGNAEATPVNIAVNGIELEVQKQGRGDTTVVFEAGFGTDLRTWQAVIAALNPANYTTIAYSRAGLGKSSAAASPRSIQQHIDDLHALLKALQLHGDIILVGHSYGGLLATEYARQFPEQLSALVLIDPAVMAQRRIFLHADKQHMQRDDQMMLNMMPPAMKADYQMLIAQLDAAPATVNPISASMRTSLITSTKRYDEPFVFEETEQGKQLWLAIHNTLFGQVLNGSHIRISSAGHNVHLEQPQRIAQLITTMANWQ